MSAVREAEALLKANPKVTQWVELGSDLGVKLQSNIMYYKVRLKHSEAPYSHML